MLDTLVRALFAEGFPPVVLNGRVVVLPHGGRVIGLYPKMAKGTGLCVPERTARRGHTGLSPSRSTHEGPYNPLYPEPSRNAFWVNPRLGESGWLADATSQPGWANLGGDRTWISPEVETNIADPLRIQESYDVPKAIDPGAYAVTAATASSVTLASDITLLFRRSAAEITVRLVKTVSVLTEPPLALPPGVDFAGYRTETSLSLLGDAPDSVHPGIWSLIQVPGGGAIEVPVDGQPSPRAFIGKPACEHRAGTLVAAAPAPVSYKFGVHATQSLGRLLYRSAPGGGAALLVACSFEVREPDLYFDTPADDPSETGYMTQVYVDDGGLGGFGEMEHHSPGIDPGAGRTTVRDTAEVIAFSGPPDALAVLGEACLSDARRNPGRGRAL